MELIYIRMELIFQHRLRKLQFLLMHHFVGDIGEVSAVGRRDRARAAAARDSSGRRSAGPRSVGAHDRRPTPRPRFQNALGPTPAPRAADLRGQGLSARTIAVKLRDFDFKTRSAQRTLREPVVSDRVILETAHELLAALRKTRRVPARLVGVRLTGLAPASPPDPLPLFGSSPADGATETDRDRSLAKAIDQVRGKYGAKGIVPGGLTDKHGRKRTFVLFGRVSRGARTKPAILEHAPSLASQVGLTGLT